MQKSERHWVFVFALIVMTLTMIPYILGFANQGEDWVFSGFIFGIEDANIYTSVMQSGAEGEWLYISDYTNFPQEGLLVLFPYILLGKLLPPTASHTAFAILFHVFRFFAGLVMIWGTAQFIAVFIKEVRLRRWALGVSILGGGLGWLLILLGQDTWLGNFPLDFYSPEAFGFLSLFGIPHLALARGLFLGGLGLYINLDLPGFKNLEGLKTGFLLLLLGLAQPLTLGVAWVVVGAHLGLTWLLRKKERGIWKGYLRRAIIAGLISLPILAFTAYQLSTDAFALAWREQNLIRSPHPLHYLAAYMLVIPLAYFGVRRIWREDFWRGSLLVGWVFVWPILVYFPVNVQRRFGEGFWVALVVLAFWGLDKFPWLKKRIGLVAITFLTTILLYAGSILTVLNPIQPVYLPIEQANFYEILNNHPNLKPDSLVLASFETGKHLPAWLPVQVLVGRGPESIGFDNLLPQVKAFYSSQTTDEERLAFLKEYQIQYVFWGPEEKTLGDWNPDSATFLRVSEKVGEYEFYRVVWE